MSRGEAAHLPNELLTNCITLPCRKCHLPTNRVAAASGWEAEQVRRRGLTTPMDSRERARLPCTVLARLMAWSAMACTKGGKEWQGGGVAEISEKARTEGHAASGQCRRKATAGRPPSLAARLPRAIAVPCDPRLQLLTWRSKDTLAASSWMPSVFWWCSLRSLRTCGAAGNTQQAAMLRAQRQSACMKLLVQTKRTPPRQACKVR